MSLVRNSRAFPGFVGFVFMMVSTLIPVLRPVVPFLAIITTLIFWYAYRQTPMAAKRLAATMGAAMALAIGVLSVLPVPTSATTILIIIIAAAGTAAAFANTFFNYCLGCNIHNWWITRKAPAAHTDN